jgi:hypothetical protein
MVPSCHFELFVLEMMMTSQLLKYNHVDMASGE